MSNYLESAFRGICKEAKEPVGAYVCLMEEQRNYLGPWEGGTYGSDYILAAYQWFETEEAAQAARAQVEQLARELSEQAQTEHGEYCLRTMEWLDERGLDADFLPEPDGPSRYYVMVSEGLPESQYASRTYE